MFKLMKILNGRANVAESAVLVPTASESFSYGEALVLSGGKATKCGATAIPTHICGEDHVAKSTGTDTLIAYPVSGDMLFEAPVSAAPTALTAGSKVTLSADAMSVTATTASGVATIVDMQNAAATGDKLVVKF